MSKSRKKPNVIANRRARYDYALGDEFVVGLVLNGRETKALRLGQGSLQGAYVTIKDGELYLVNMLIAGQGNLQMSEQDRSRSRKLLAKKSEIGKLAAAKQQGNTIVPLEILNKGRYIKIKIAVGRGKKRYDKRETIKKREFQRRTRIIQK